eukprot:m.125500 g.125500  ORF g.125500 m.125500 type:complete len:183 (-) comp17328_c0_seq3:1865-2413(-)
MGCLSSKLEAESGDRVVADVSQTLNDPRDSNQRQPASSIKTVPIDMSRRPGAGLQQAGNTGLSQSYTEARLQEEKLFENIIHKTEYNLITAGGDQDEYTGSARDVMQRLSEYNSLLPGSGTSTVARLPAPSASNTDVGAILGAAGVDTAMIHAAVKRLNAAFACMDVTDVGAVVVDLPAIPT